MVPWKGLSPGREIDFGFRPDDPPSPPPVQVPCVVVCPWNEMCGTILCPRKQTEPPVPCTQFPGLLFIDFVLVRECLHVSRPFLFAVNFAIIYFSI